METKPRGKFASKLGIILASAGSAVGLGNIWRFPTETGENGGAAFILIYICCILLLGLPVMLSEFMIGRHAHANAATAFEKLAPGKKQWHWIGRLGVVTGTMILSFYNVVAGWTANYSVCALGNGFNRMSESGDPNVFTDYFNSFVTGTYAPVAYLIGFMLLTHIIVVLGVEKGIERFSKLMMPVLFILLLLLAGCALTMDGAADGLRFLFQPNFSKIDPGVVLSAMGQAFFSLSLGIGCLCTYASYFKEDVNLGKTAFSVAGIDTMVAIIAGIIIFPAVFSVPGMEPTEGPKLVFVALPHIFKDVFGGLPLLSYLVPFLFYFLLVLASLTSTISMHEVITAYISEVHHLSRKTAATLVTTVCIILSTLCSLSLGAGSEWTIGGMTLFDFFDYATAKWMLPVGGFFIAIFAGWFLNRQILWNELTNKGSIRFYGFKAFLFLLRFVAPLGILLIFLNELGWLAF